VGSKPGPSVVLDRQSLENALEHDAPLPLERVVQIVERFGAVDGIPRDVRDLMGTPRYAPPEEADATSEQFSLAAIAYHLLTGHPPFADDKLRDGPPEPIRAYRPDLSIALEGAVLRALAREGRVRYPSLPEFVASFRSAADSRADGGERGEATTVSAVPSDIAQLLRRRRGRALFTAPTPSAMNDELTVVGGAITQDEPTVIGPSGRAQQPPGVRADLEPAPVRPPTVPPAATVHADSWTLQFRLKLNRPGPAKVAVTIAGLVLAVGAAVLWNVFVRSSPTSARVAVRPQAPAAAGAPVAVAPLAGPPGQPSTPHVAIPPPAPAARTVASPGPAAPPPAEPAVSAPVAERSGLLRGRTRARTVRDDTPAAAPGRADAPKNCRISVGSYPWSNVWIDGADTGLQTPVVNLALSCGRHRLGFKRKDLNVDQIETVTLNEGNELKRQYELKGRNLDD
jgi:hypothetical protein